MYEKAASDTSSEQIPSPSFLSHRSHRLVVCLLLLFANYFVTENTLAMSTAVVCMVNSSSHTEHEKQQTAYRTCSVQLRNESSVKHSFAIAKTLDWSPSQQSILLSPRFYGGCLTVAFAGLAADKLGPVVVLTGKHKLTKHEETYLALQAYWSCTIWIAIAYVMAIHTIEKVMEGRLALNLKWPLVIWNSALAVFSMIGTIRMGEEIIHVVSTYPIIDSISYGLDPYQPAAFWGLCFAFSKFFELVDTIFVVLRKKKLIFLHWYHHAIVLVYVWHAVKDSTAAGRWFVFMNYFVHSLMYAYYAVSAVGIRLPRSLCMTITFLQTAQMFIGVAISFIVFYCKMEGMTVQHTYENLYFCFAIYVSFAVLFSNFFNKSYLKEEKN